jgi:predicted Zn finger-like uncharacterized protein
VIIECSNCHARYQYDEARFEQKPSKKIKCAKCGTVFEIHNPSAARTAPAVPAAAAAPAKPKPSAGESTHASKPKQTIEKETAEREAAPEPGAGGELPPLQMPAGKRLSLAIIDGANAGTVFRIAKPRVTVGRSGADLVIDDTEASRQHAALEVRDTVFLVRDLDSKNGTFVDGQRIGEPTELQDKSEFVIGTTTLMLIVTNEA